MYRINFGWFEDKFNEVTFGGYFFKWKSSISNDCFKHLNTTSMILNGYFTKEECEKYWDKPLVEYFKDVYSIEIKQSHKMDGRVKQIKNIRWFTWSQVFEYAKTGKIEGYK